MKALAFVISVAAFVAAGSGTIQAAPIVSLPADIRFDAGDVTQVHYSRHYYRPYYRPNSYYRLYYYGPYYYRPYLCWNWSSCW